MATLDHKLFAAEHRHRVLVRMADREINDARWNEAMEFCSDSDKAGSFDWLPSMADIDNVNFYFTDENVAFEFKMKFA